ncbi:MAG: MerR family transcriptional regulator [Lachnospiraceae bacterium]|nr:MerR family transcriptional regulator [Lachnospiraceae bacterium]
MNNETGYSVGEAASICHVTIQTLRYYDKLGLVQPAIRNAATGYRYYKKEQLIRIQMIKHLKELGFSLEEIQGLLTSTDIKYLTEQVQTRLLAIWEEIEQMQAKYYSGYLFMERLQQGSSVLKRSLEPGAFDEDIVQIENIPAQDWIYIRRMKHNYHNEEINIDRWAELLELVRKEKAQAAGAISIVYHNQPLEQFYATVCDYETCMPVKAVPTEHAQYYRHQDAYLAATTFHIGPYDSLIHSYMTLMRWVSENGYKVCGDMQDVFIISPIDTNNPEEYVTKIIAPISKLM